MDSVRRFLRSPVKVRALPYILFVLPINLGGLFELDSYFWMYVGRTVLGAGLILVMWPLVKEMRYELSWEAVAVGVAVFVMWVGIDPLYPHTSSAPWNPFASVGDTALAWFFVTVRVLGSSLVVPPLEEVFFRSFLYRSIVKADFQSVSWTHFSWRPLLITAVIFGFIHDAWLSGILCALGYQWIVIRKNRLGDAMTAHAITNWLLGIWIVWKGAWSLW